MFSFLFFTKKIVTCMVHRLYFNKDVTNFFFSNFKNHLLGTYYVKNRGALKGLSRSSLNP